MRLQIFWTMLDIKRLLGNKTLLAIAVIAYTSAITIAFLMPTSGLPQVNLPGGTDKSIHLVIHFVLVLLWQLYSFYRNNQVFSWKNGALVLSGSLLYGIIIEMLQGYITTSRTPDIFDVLANFCGALIGVILFQKIKYFIAS